MTLGGGELDIGRPEHSQQVVPGGSSTGPVNSDEGIIDVGGTSTVSSSVRVAGEGELRLVDDNSGVHPGPGQGLVSALHHGGT